MKFFSSKSWLWAVVLFCAVSVTQAADTRSPEEQIAASCQTGTLIFSEGDCLAVRAYTCSSFTHVAVVVMKEDQPFVYDSMNGVGVRCLSLDEYLETQAPDEVCLYHPKREFTTDETEKFENFLDEQIGRPYSVSHHLTGRRCEGMHCSEYVTEALAKIDWLKVNNPARVSPASLAAGIAEYAVFHDGGRIEIPYEAEPIPEPRNSCERMWQDFKFCVSGSGKQMSRWFLCR